MKNIFLILALFPLLLNGQINKSDVNGKNVYATDSMSGKYIIPKKVITYPANPSKNLIVNYKDTLKRWDGTKWTQLGKAYYVKGGVRLDGDTIKLSNGTTSSKEDIIIIRSDGADSSYLVLQPLGAYLYSSMSGSYLAIEGDGQTHLVQSELFIKDLSDNLVASFNSGGIAFHVFGDILAQGAELKTLNLNSSDSAYVNFQKSGTDKAHIVNKDDELYFKNNLGIRKSLTQLANGGKTYFAGKGTWIGPNYKLNFGDSATSTMGMIYTLGPYFTRESYLQLGSPKPFDQVIINGQSIQLYARDSVFTKTHNIQLYKDHISLNADGNDSLDVYFGYNHIVAKGNELYFKNNLGIYKSLSQLNGLGAGITSIGNGLSLVNGKIGLDHAGTPILQPIFINSRDYVGIYAEKSGNSSWLSLSPETSNMSIGISGGSYKTSYVMTNPLQGVDIVASSTTSANLKKESILHNDTTGLYLLNTVDGVVQLTHDSLRILKKDEIESMMLTSTLGDVTLITKSYDASGGSFPSTGSGEGGAIKKSDYYVISVGGTLGGKTIEVGTTLTADIDNPGQDIANWIILDKGTTLTPVAAGSTSKSVVAYNGTTAEDGKFYGTGTYGLGFKGKFTFNGPTAYSAATTINNASGTLTINGALGNVFIVNMTGNITSISLTNMGIGSYYIEFNNSSTYTITFGSSCIWQDGGAPLNTRTTGSKDVLFGMWNGSKMICNYMFDVK